MCIVNSYDSIQNVDSSYCVGWSSTYASYIDSNHVWHTHIAPGIFDEIL